MTVLFMSLTLFSGHGARSDELRDHCALSLQSQLTPDTPLNRILALAQRLLDSDAIGDFVLLQIVDHLRSEDAVEFAMPASSTAMALSVRAIGRELMALNTSDRMALAKRLETTLAERMGAVAERARVTEHAIPSFSKATLIYIEPGQVEAPTVVGVQQKIGWVQPATTKRQVQASGFWISDIVVTMHFWSQVMETDVPRGWEDLPITNINHIAALNFLDRINSILRSSGIEALDVFSGTALRGLPSGRFQIASLEEYALVAKEIRDQPNGSPDPSNSWGVENSELRLRPVGQLRPFQTKNGLIFDFEGNVREMTRDFYEDRVGHHELSFLGDHPHGRGIDVGTSFGQSPRRSLENDLILGFHSPSEGSPDLGIRLVYIPDAPIDTNASPISESPYSPHDRSKLDRLRGWLKHALGRFHFTR